jgi:mersacidin/lichenicidin family type 2 lantibiotic
MEVDKMDFETQIRAWKDPKFRSTLKAEDLLPNPAGTRLVELDEEEIRGTWGGQRSPNSSGYICSTSGECNGTGQSCWSAA